MEEDLVLYGYDNIKVDDTLENEVKIEYSYPEINENINLDIELDSCGFNCYHLGTNVKQVKWNKKIIDDIIENLKDKKIYTYEFYIEKTVYLSRENYVKLIDNNEKYDYYETKKELKTFNKTYNVINVEESNTYGYLYLTLKDLEQEEVETVRVLKSVAGNVIEGQNYEFTFEYSGEDLDTRDIDEIFDECKLKKVIHKE